MQEHPKTLFLKILDFDNFAPDYPSLKELRELRMRCRRGRCLGFLWMRISRRVFSQNLVGGLFVRNFAFAGGFVVDGFKEGKVEARLGMGKASSNEGSGRGLSSEDSENTGVPCLKEVFSVLFSEELEEEESISSITGKDCATDRGVA